MNPISTIFVQFNMALSEVETYTNYIKKHIFYKKYTYVSTSDNAILNWMDIINLEDLLTETESNLFTITACFYF